MEMANWYPQNLAGVLGTQLSFIRTVRPVQNRDQLPKLSEGLKYGTVSECW